MINQLEQLGLVALDKSFRQLTTIRVGGHISIYFEPTNIFNLVSAIDIINEHKVAYKIIGNGSNLLCSDEAYDGVVIKLNNINHYEMNDNIMYVEAGVPIITAANFAINNGFAGLEFAMGIPAFVGGVLYMNAGAYNEEISDVVESVLVYRDKQLQWLSKNELEYAYRKSVFQEHDWIIVAANLRLVPANSDRLKEISVKRNRRRFETQPFDYPTFGSTFRNLPGKRMWELIDEMNLRGKMIGDAQISLKHSNFICNLGNAKANDINQLIDLMIDHAKEDFDVDLYLEVERFNW
ncbi:MAG: UDP-N-acetylmuramate dehydrogenase [Erysipelothrix sp.]|nr:UDP-N-acetylmuramate dehydrogenase [Erysipelothrix sp.]